MTKPKPKRAGTKKPQARTVLEQAELLCGEWAAA